MPGHLHCSKATQTPGCAVLASALERLDRLQDGLLDVATDLADGAAETDSATLAATATDTINAVVNVHTAAERLAAAR